MEQPDIIDGLRRYLAERLAGVPVYGFLPRDPPGRFVLIDRVGGTRGLAVDAPRITVEAWAPTKSSAYAPSLAARARDLARPLDDDRIGLRHDPHGPEHRHDDEQDDETDDDEEDRLDIGHGAASP